MIAFTCTGCQTRLTIHDGLGGKKVRCPGCGTVTQAPAPAATSPTVAQQGPTAFSLPGGPNAATDLPVLATASTSHLPGAEREHDSSLTSFLAPAQAADELGRLGGFRILAILRQGGMGVVFRGEDPRLGRPVAIKAMLPHLAGSLAAQQRFLREARAAAALQHDHIVPILQVGEDRGAPFIVMPLLQGEPLDRRLQRGRALPTAEVLRIGREIASGLAAAHAAGLIHRDIKPSNIWLEAGSDRVKVLDFGLARPAGQDSSLTQTGAILGTPAYMAPEQGRGERVDARCDLWGLGVVLYQMCTGRLPFKGRDAVSTLLAVAQTNPPPPATIHPEVAAGLSELVMRLLAKEPAQRPASAQAVVEALTALEQSRPAAQVLASPGPPPLQAEEAAATLPFVDQRPTPNPTQGRRSRRALVLALSGVVAAALVAGIALLVGGRGDHGPGPDDAGASKGRRTTVPARKAGPVGRTGKEEQAKTIHNSIGMKLVLIPAGKFQMGSTREEQDAALKGLSEEDRKIAGAIVRAEGPRHEVEISEPFYMSAHEVTQKQYRTVMGKNPSSYCKEGDDRGRVKGLDTDDFPVENVSWEDAQAFLTKLSALPKEKEKGRTYRLPTEAQWEYAARGGGPAGRAYHFGDRIDTSLANFGAYHNEKGAPGRPCKVGSYRANGFGLYDMHGNVWEWCADWHAGDYYAKSPPKDPPGPARGAFRVARGGSWGDAARACRAAYRGQSKPGHRGSAIGFRVVCLVAGAP